MVEFVYTHCIKIVGLFFSPPNARSLSVLSLSFNTAQWKDLCVGDVLRLHKGQVIPVSPQIHETKKLEAFFAQIICHRRWTWMRCNKTV